MTWKCKRCGTSFPEQPTICGNCEGTDFERMITMTNEELYAKELDKIGKLVQPFCPNGNWSAPGRLEMASAIKNLLTKLAPCAVCDGKGIVKNLKDEKPPWIECDKCKGTGHSGEKTEGEK